MKTISIQPHCCSSAPIPPYCHTHTAILPYLVWSPTGWRGYQTSPGGLQVSPYTVRGLQREYECDREAGRGRGKWLTFSCSAEFLQCSTKFVYMSLVPYQTLQKYPNNAYSTLSLPPSLPHISTTVPEILEGLSSCEHHLTFQYQHTSSIAWTFFLHFGTKSWNLELLGAEKSSSISLRNCSMDWESCCLSGTNAAMTRAGERETESSEATYEW